MTTNHLLFEGYPVKQRRALLENSVRAIKTFENLALLFEGKNLTPEEVDALFTAIEQNGGRTVLGKGVDVVKGAALGIQQLWSMMMDSKPVRNFDAAWFKLIRKLRDKLGGKENSAIVRAFSAYATWAKNHPILQGFFIAALMALVTATGSGVLGVSAAYAAIKGINSILKGERLSRALMKAAVYAVAGYAVRSLGEMLVNDLIPIDKLPDLDLKQPGFTISKLPVNIRDAYNMAFSASRKAGAEAFNWTHDGVTHVSNTLLRSETPVTPEQVAAILKKAGTGAYKTFNFDGLVKTTIVPTNESYRGKSGLRPIITESNQHRIITLRNRHQYVTLTPAEIDYVMEGILDWAKKKAKQVGSALTNKITKAGLEAAWNKAKPNNSNDSDDLYAFLVAYKPEVLDQNIVSRVYRELNIPSQHTRYPDGNPQPDPRQPDTPQTDPRQPDTPQTDPRQPTPGTPDNNQKIKLIKEIKKLTAALKKLSKQLAAANGDLKKLEAAETAFNLTVSATATSNSNSTSNVTVNAEGLEEARKKEIDLAVRTLQNKRGKLRKEVKDLQASIAKAVETAKSGNLALAKKLADRAAARAESEAKSATNVVINLNQATAGQPGSTAPKPLVDPYGRPVTSAAPAVPAADKTTYHLENGYYINQTTGDKIRKDSSEGEKIKSDRSTKITTNESELTILKNRIKFLTERR